MLLFFLIILYNNISKFGIYDTAQTPDQVSFNCIVFPLNISVTASPIGKIFKIFIFLKSCFPLSLSLSIAPSHYNNIQQL
jgi:hypothetical protein